MYQTSNANTEFPDGGDDLLERLRHDDEAARRELFQRFEGPLRRHFVRTLPDRTQAEDCANEVIISALESIARGAQPQDLDKWLWGIARYVASERHLARPRRDERLVHDPAAGVLVAAGDPVSRLKPVPPHRPARTWAWPLTALLVLAIVAIVVQVDRPHGSDRTPPPAGSAPEAQQPITDDSGEPATAPSIEQSGTGSPSSQAVTVPLTPPQTAVTPGFTSLGGTVTSTPTAVHRRGAGIDLFARGLNGGLWHNYSNDGHTWGGWESLGGYLIGAPAAASATPNGLDVFGIGADHTLYHMSYDPTDHTFGAWVSMGAPPGRSIVSAPATVSWDVGRIDVAVVTNDGSIAGQYYQNGSWSGWGSVPGRSGATSLAEGSWGPGRLDVVFLDTDNELWSRYFDAGNWSSLGNQSAAGLSPHLNPSTTPALASRGYGRLDIFALDTAGALRSRSWAAGAWSAWANNGGSWLYGPAAASLGCGGLYLFVVGPDRSVYQNQWATATNCA
jgi:hypothetical protein